MDGVNGYKIKFRKIPKQSFFDHKATSRVINIKLIKQEVKSLLNKGAIVKCRRTKGQVVSPFFTVTKPDGSQRFIINLKRLNKYIVAPHFKMEDLRTATRLISPGDYIATIDLQDAYFAVPVHRTSQKYLTFKFQNNYFRFTCLPFGLCTSPYIFTKILKPVLKLLRSRGFMSVAYLDDLLCIANTFEECVINVSETINLLQSLGFIINFKKSNLTPSRNSKYLGFILDTENSLLKLTNKKKENLLSTLKSLLILNDCKIKVLARLLGKLVAACPAIKYGWLYTKSLESEKLKALERSKGNYKAIMFLSKEIKEDLCWWINNIPGSSKSFKVESYAKTIYTDASDGGWGATDKVNEFFGFWNKQEISTHINYKELLAIKYALKEIADNMKNCNLLLRVDNTTAIAYLNRMGGVRIKKFNLLAKSIWQWAEKRNIFLRASYIESKENKDADRLSRILNKDAEWELGPQFYNEIIQTFGLPDVDIFASKVNKKCERYFSWMPDREALAIDAFTVSWNDIYFYAFPPFILVLKTLHKIQQELAEGIMVVPKWPNQPWYPLFLKLVKSDIIEFHPCNDLLLSLCRKQQHPRASHLTILAAIVSGKRSVIKIFQKNL